jgi:hypothetical protein
MKWNYKLNEDRKKIVGERKHATGGLHRSFKPTDSVEIFHGGETLIVTYQGLDDYKNAQITFLGPKTFNIEKASK